MLSHVWPRDVRAMPADLLRSSLFTINRYGMGAERPRRHKTLLFSMSNFELRATGEETNIFDADVLEVSGERAVCSAFDARVAAAVDGSVGQGPAVIVIRPERISLHGRDDRVADDRNVIRGTVAEVVYLGASTQVHVDVGAIETCVHVVDERRHGDVVEHGRKRVEISAKSGLGRPAVEADA